MGQYVIKFRYIVRIIILQQDSTKTSPRIIPRIFEFNPLHLKPPSSHTLSLSKTPLPISSISPRTVIVSSANTRLHD